MTIAKGVTSSRLTLPVSKGLATGVYTLVLKGSASYQPDPKGKAKYKV